MDLVVEIYKETEYFPKEEIYGIVSQMRRCVVSIPSNISEGYGRNSLNDLIRFLYISKGSLNELETQIEISFRLGYIGKDRYKGYKAEIEIIHKMLNALKKSLRTKMNLEESKSNTMKKTLSNK